jgi:hypothetical protein
MIIIKSDNHGSQIIMVQPPVGEEIQRVRECKDNRSDAMNCDGER